LACPETPLLPLAILQLQLLRGITGLNIAKKRWPGQVCLLLGWQWLLHILWQRPGPDTSSKSISLPHMWYEHCRIVGVLLLLLSETLQRG
jgi:hypothetical protein